MIHEKGAAWSCILLSLRSHGTDTEGERKLQFRGARLHYVEQNMAFYVGMCSLQVCFIRIYVWMFFTGLFHVEV